MTMILVSLLMVTIMAMAALVIDVGGLVQERRELQNGADAAALSVAHSCALNEALCTNATSIGQVLADANATDGAAAIDDIDVDRANRRVRVVTSTRTSSGSSILPFRFAQAVTGRSGQAVRATATATWGPPANGIPLPLTLSKCEFEAAGLDTTVVIFHTSTSGHCSEGPGGRDLPGGFGWLDPTSGDGCTADITADRTVSANTGVSAPSSCDLRALLGKTVLVPIFDDYSRTGTKATYEIVGFGAFRLTGFRFPAIGSAGSPPPCQSPQTCIGGTFTRFITDAGSIGGSDFGVAVVKLVS